MSPEQFLSYLQVQWEQHGARFKSHPRFMNWMALTPEQADGITDRLQEILPSDENGSGYYENDEELDDKPVYNLYFALYNLAAHFAPLPSETPSPLSSEDNALLHNGKAIIREARESGNLYEKIYATAIELAIGMHMQQKMRESGSEACIPVR